MPDTSIISSSDTFKQIWNNDLIKFHVPFIWFKQLNTKLKKYCYEHMCVVSI